MSISKKYSPADIEDKWYDYWMEHQLFRSTPDEREAYTIVIPPPNVTGILHMGHMLNNTIQDVLIRRKRMEGYNACWVPGTDHASIATEAKVVKMLKEEHGLDKKDISREEFLKYAYQWKDKYGGIILKQLRKLGASCDWERTHFTMDSNYYQAVIDVFCDLHDKGHIYRGIRMVNWDPKGKTALSDEEVIHKDIAGKLYHVKYQIEGSDNEFVTIATTRPETILGDVAISVHPEDERYKHLHGKRALVPLINRSIPIIADDYVQIDFGTGCLKVTPAHDINDYEIGIRHKLPSIDVLNPDGSISEAGEMYVGEDRFVVRKKIVKDIKAIGQLVEIEDYNHSVGFSERTDVPIEPRLSMQWFLNMDDLHKPAYTSVMDDVVKLVPPKFKNSYRHWMDNIRDWCISRQLWWGQRIPAWYLPDGDYVVASTAEGALERARKKSGNPSLELTDLRQDPDVLDTWFSSWLWPIEVFKGMTDPDNEEINYYYPTNDLVTAPEILFFWVARMIIAGYEYKGERPFNNVYLTGIVRDKLRRKMSKSLGNSPDPLDLIGEFGADGVRVGMLLSSPAGNDLLFDAKLVEQGRNFSNKIWNAFRLVDSWETEDKESDPVEQLALNWMRNRLDQAKNELVGQFEQFRISEALMTVYKVIWDEFCSWFLELMKPPYGEKMAASSKAAVISLFEEIMKVAHPFTPFISEEIWQGLASRTDGASICVETLSSVETAPNQSILDEMELIKEVVTAVRNFRVEKGLKNKDSIELYIKTNAEAVFTTYNSILAKFLNTSTIEFAQDGPEGSVSIHVRQHELFIPLGDSVDVASEIEKMEKDLDYTKGFLTSVMKKLGNERFVQNAPEQVVANEKKKKADAEERIKALEESLDKLRQLQ